MKLRTFLAFSIVVLAHCGKLLAQPEIAAPALPLRQDFENGAGDWTTFGDGAKISMATENADVHGGKSALRFNYKIEKGKFSALVLPLTAGVLARAGTFRFWVKSDAAEPLAFVLQEHEGGRYIAVFSAPKDVWQQVILAPSDFSLSQEKGDPQDPDNKLDLDKIEGFGLADLRQLFAQAQNPDPNLAALLNVQTGAHTIFVDDFEINDEVLPVSPAPENAINLDSFARPQAMWIGLGDVQLSIAGRLQEHSLQAVYQQAAGKPIGFLKPLPRGKLAKATSLNFVAASLNPATLMVQVEATGGGKYNARIEIPGGAEDKEISLNFADFKPADDNKDDDNQLDLEQVKQIVIIDASGILGTGEGENTLRVSNLRAVIAP